MNSNFETGHAKNAALFASMIDFCKGYGAKYLPATAALEITQLEALHLAVHTAMETNKDFQMVFNLATNERQSCFAKLRPLAQRIIYALSALGASKLSIDEAKTIYRKIQGRRAKTPAEPVDPNEAINKSNSVSQVSYDNLLANFSALVQLIAMVPEYAPNESDLQPANLKAYVDELKAANLAVIKAYTNWSNSRISRDELLYAKGTGLVDVALQIKNYIRSLFGIGSPQFKQMSGLTFTRTKE